MDYQEKTKFRQLKLLKENGTTAKKVNSWESRKLRPGFATLVATLRPGHRLSRTFHG